MELQYSELIAIKSEQLSECIDLDVLIQNLMLEEIVTVPMFEAIYNETDVSFRKKKFLEELSTWGPDAFSKFIEVLKLTGQEKAVWLLEGSVRADDETQSSAIPNRSRSPNVIDKQTEVVESGDERSAAGLRSNEDVYVMESVPRGYCLIINNIDFNGLRDYRCGSEVDVKRLKAVFNDLGYEITLKENLTGKGMETVLYDFSKNDSHKTVDSSVVIILSHGLPGCIEGTDIEKLYIDDMLKLFNNENCQNLIGKPKLFFLIACRGDEYDSGVMIAGSKDSGRNPLETSVIVNDRRVPTLTDMLVAYSTSEGYVSIRDHFLGSWYCQALCNVLRQFASKLDLQEMLGKVDRIVQKFVAGSGELQVTEVSVKGWGKKLYFNVQ